MDNLDLVAYILVIVGALNWGLVGAFNFNLVEFLLGSFNVLFQNIVYVLIGFSGLYLGYILLRSK